MVATIILLAAFECYWLVKLYKDEYKTFSSASDVAFRSAISKLQRQRFEKDTALSAHSGPTMITANSVPFERVDSVKNIHKFPLQTLSPKAADQLRNIDPEKIKSITIYSGDAATQRPELPVELLETMAKQKIRINTAADSVRRRFFLRYDSASNRVVAMDREGEATTTIAVRMKDSDSMKLHQFTDSASFAFRTRLNLRLDSLKRRHGRDSVKRGITAISVHEKPGAASIHGTVKADQGTEVVNVIGYGVRGKNTDSFRSGKSQPEFNVKGMVVDMPMVKRDLSPMIRFLIENKTVNDSIPVKTIDSAYKTELSKTMTRYPSYRIVFRQYAKDSLRKKDTLAIDSSRQVITSKVYAGYNTPYSYQASFGDVRMYLLQQMKLQIGGSVLLLVLVLGSFIIMYRNLLAQQKLAGIKNDFISNITHELKTPIATVTVAIEALRNFNAIQSPERTREYLDISASELQRLSLLVDKVLKLSMFENKKVELKKETFDLKELVEETMLTMRLQFEKQKAEVSFTTEGGPFTIVADKLHITSVIFNLLDNALKYSQTKAVIAVALAVDENGMLELKVSDNGIGIAHQYQGKVFDKFFRVPMGDKHNIKGYGLGLSYVAEIVKKHEGSIHVESVLGKGSAFIVKLPANNHSEPTTN
ncbi:His Kinase A (phospho-acceptor) domain-containing protein [Sediminibacterium ginsengisoli]|uniref:histidine kinase n=2 Tax=Sediminibacterium ginsengisoli TaxID=413434 RepID=A0A1T4LWH0_9BACT|nr:His Kinase A (phospho-acceptor) domain-containing protein [Sediminibacterium ginsengisoli]